MKLKYHPADKPAPEGMRPFVRLDFETVQNAPSLIANTDTAAPQASIEDNIRVNTARGLPFLVGPVRRPARPLVIVCYGPSLLTTWEGITPEGGDILTCSGAHDFLISRGVIPDMHTECDPRPHKAHFLANPHPGVQYRLATRVHPTMVDHVETLDTVLFHQRIDSEVALCEALSPGVPHVPVGTTNGMSAITLGMFMGYTDIRVYGMDGCFRNAAEHAGGHPNPNEAPHSWVEIDGRQFETSMLHLLALQDLFMIVLTSPGLKIEFRGDGMLAWALAESRRKWNEAHGKPAIG